MASRIGLFTVLSIAALLASASVDAADKTVKIGVLTDMSGVAVDDMGPGSVLAGQMAAEDMGGSVAGMKIEIVFADHLQKPPAYVRPGTMPEPETRHYSFDELLKALA